MSYYYIIPYLMIYLFSYYTCVYMFWLPYISYCYCSASLRRIAVSSLSLSAHYQSACITVYLRLLWWCWRWCACRPLPSVGFTFRWPWCSAGDPPLPSLAHYLLFRWNLLRLGLYAANYYEIWLLHSEDHYLL